MGQSDRVSKKHRDFSYAYSMYSYINLINNPSTSELWGAAAERSLNSFLIKRGR